MVKIYLSYMTVKYAENMRSQLLNIHGVNEFRDWSPQLITTEIWRDG
jgi:hypothetical protein